MRSPSVISIKVVRRSGEVETILVLGQEGAALNRLECEGCTHYFDKDGNYDGWAELWRENKADRPA